MSRLERHYAEQLDELSSKVLAMGGLVEHALARALNALNTRDRELARSVLKGDDEINRMELDIDQLGLEILARYQPAARDLRLIVASLQISTDLERTGDLAANLCKRVMELCDEPPLERPLVDLAAMGEHAREMLRSALDAFLMRDPDAARAVIRTDDDLDDRLDESFSELVAHMKSDSTNIMRSLRMAFVAKYLERIGDQATNICELVVFMAEGTVIKHVKLSADDDEPPTVPRPDASHPANGEPGAGES